MVFGNKMFIILMIRVVHVPKTEEPFSLQEVDFLAKVKYLTLG